MAHTHESIIRDLRANRYSPLYFLQGEETFFIDQVLQFIEKHALPEEEKGFNQVSFYGKDSDLKTIVSQARRFPMMASRQVVLVKEAQDLADWKDESSLKILLSYLENPLESTVLVFAYKRKSMPKSTKVIKAIDKKGVVLTTKKMYDNKLPDWIKAQVQAKNFAITDRAAYMIAEYVGVDLERVSNELSKMLLNFKGEEKLIDEQAVSSFIGVSKEYNPFELQKALAFRDLMKANRIINFFGNNPKDYPVIPLISILFNFFSKLLLIHHADDKSDAALSKKLGLHVFILKEYRLAAQNYSLKKVVACIRYLKEADLRSKGIDCPKLSEKDILRELVFKLMH
ncbi:MAG: DNA polymerase III subunit delta [Cytophagales bacterium]|nr:DNA polymerase III subunit delta [Cytophagales bacterium]